MTPITFYDIQHIELLVEMLPPAGFHKADIEEARIVEEPQGTFLSLTYRLNEWGAINEELCVQCENSILGEGCKKYGHQAIRQLCNATHILPDFPSMGSLVGSLLGKSIAIEISHVFQDGELIPEITSRCGQFELRGTNEGEDDE